MSTTSVLVRQVPSLSLLCKLASPEDMYLQHDLLVALPKGPSALLATADRHTATETWPRMHDACLRTKHSRSRKERSQGLVTTGSTTLAKGAVSLGAWRPVRASLGPKRAMVNTTPAGEHLQ